MHTSLTEYDLQERIHAFLAGEDSRCYQWLGCHYAGDGGYTFRVWAPQAAAVSLVGDFCGWDAAAQPMEPLGSGVWECSLQNIDAYTAYKYHMMDTDGQAVDVTDPFAACIRPAPHEAGLVCDIGGYLWQDEGWRSPVCPLNIYEVHLASWRRYANGEVFSYETLCEELIPYVCELGFTHVRLWAFAEGLAPAPCHGTPHAFMAFVDACHRAGLGVLVDWIPPSDDALVQRSIGSSRVRYWLEEYHIDGMWAAGESAVHPLWQEVKSGFPHSLLLQEAPGDVKPSADRSLLTGMPGSYEQQFAGVRALLAYRLLSPGTRRLFMGDEFGQQKPWDPDGSLDWLLLEYESHRMLRHYVRSLNALYLETPALWEGAVWTAEDGVLTAHLTDGVTAVCNTTPALREGFRVGLPDGGSWVELFSSDLAEFGGEDRRHPAIAAQLLSAQGYPYSAALTLPPLSAVLLKGEDHHR